jgi:hypothetical protein
LIFNIQTIKNLVDHAEGSALNDITLSLDEDDEDSVSYFTKDMQP